MSHQVLQDPYVFETLVVFKYSAPPIVQDWYHYTLKWSSNRRVLTQSPPLCRPIILTTIHTTSQEEWGTMINNMWQIDLTQWLLCSVWLGCDASGNKNWFAEVILEAEDLKRVSYYLRKERKGDANRSMSNTRITVRVYLQPVQIARLSPSACWLVGKWAGVLLGGPARQPSASRVGIRTGWQLPSRMWCELPKMMELHWKESQYVLHYYVTSRRWSSAYSKVNMNLMNWCSAWILNRQNLEQCTDHPV